VFTARYQIQLLPAPDGRLFWAAGESRGDLLVDGSHEKRDYGLKRKVFYDDGRGRRLTYEANFEKGSYRYVLERADHHDGKVQRTIFPTLQAAVFCLTGCISRNE